METVSRLAKLQGRSKSAVINDLLESVHPPLMRTVALLEAAQDAPQQVKAGLRQTVLDLERELVGNTGSGLAQMDWLRTKFTESEGGAWAGAQPAPAPPEPKQPPYTNRGVRSPTKTPIKRKRKG